MAEQHRATSDEWACVKEYNSEISFSCILELLHRIEALEGAQSGSIDLSHLSDAELKLLANPGRFEVLEVAQPAKPNYPAKPESSLVERVAFAITGDSDGPINWKPEARAAILEVAAWLRIESLGHLGNGLHWTKRLEQEAAVIDNGTACDREPSRTARDTIRAVADWLREHL